MANKITFTITKEFINTETTLEVTAVASKPSLLETTTIAAIPDTVTIALPKEGDLPTE